MVSQNPSSFKKLQKRVLQQAVIDLVDCCRENEVFSFMVFASDSVDELSDVIHEYYDFNEFGGLCSDEGEILESMYPNIDDRIEKMNELQNIMLNTMYDVSRLPSGISLISAMKLIKKAS